MNISVHPVTARPCVSAAPSVTRPSEPDALRSRRDAPKLERGSFSLLRIIGSGSFSNVHLALEKASGRPIALKETAKAFIRHRKSASRLFSEKTILSKIHHPLVVDFCGSFQDTKKLYLAMEFVPGGDLFRLMSRRGSLTHREALFFASEVASVLVFLHSQGVVYRDLKPENVLIAGSGHIKLGDFGFAKELTKGEKTYSLCGTPHCMAPEVVSRSGHGFASDWWSLGILVHEMITGECPFDDESPYEMYAKIVLQAYVPPKGIDCDTASLIVNLLRKDPGERIGDEKVAEHPFFKDVDWGRLGDVQPPYVPQVKYPFDDSQFDVYEANLAEEEYGGENETLFEGY